MTKTKNDGEKFAKNTAYGKIGFEEAETRWLPFAVRLDYAELDEICHALEATNRKGPLLEALKKTKADLWKYLP